MRCFFLTGASGLIGQALLVRLLRQGWEGVVLLRASPKRSAQARLIRLLAEAMEDDELTQCLTHVRAVEGDVCLPDLGLDGPTRATLKALQPEVIHCAASLAFLPEQAPEVWATNLEGTQRVCALVEWLGRPAWHLVSTAYGVGAAVPVGPDAPPCMEAPFTHTGPFNNAYEASKHASEAWVLARAAQTGVKVTIFRPGCVIGDWETGRTLTFRTLYGLIDLLDQEARGLVRHGEDPAEHALVYFSDIPRDATRNVVPSSYVADVLAWGVAHPALHGGIYHLTHPEPPNRWLSNVWMAQAVGFGALLMPSEVPFRMEQRSAPRAPRLHHFSRGRLGRFSQVFRGYLEGHEPRFDTTQLQQALHGSNIVCPRVDEAYLRRIVAFCLETRWRVALERRLEQRLTSGPLTGQQLTGQQLTGQRPSGVPLAIPIMAKAEENPSQPGGGTTGPEPFQGAHA